MKLPGTLSLALAPFSQFLLKPQAPLNRLQSSAVPSIPIIGFGTWNLRPDGHNASNAVSYAIQAGYRHIDCASAYRNQKEVGKGIAGGLQAVDLTREDIWVTSKLWNDHHDADKVEEALDRTLSDLGLPYLDEFLIHWPVSHSNSSNIISFRSTWLAMEALLLTNKTRHIGISNFSPAQLADLLSIATVVPYAHQMELHPYLPQTAWMLYHYSHGIHVTAYSPLGNMNPTYDRPGKDAPTKLLDNNVVRSVASRNMCTPAQVVLAWGMGRGTSVIPKSQHVERIRENLVPCALGYEDIVELNELGKEEWRFNNPSKSWDVSLFEGLQDGGL